MVAQNLNTPELKLSLYVSISFISTLLTQLQVARNQVLSPIDWVLIVGGSLLAALISARAFFDQSISQQQDDIEQAEDKKNSLLLNPLLTEAPKGPATKPQS